MDFGNPASKTLLLMNFLIIMKCPLLQKGPVMAKSKPPNTPAIRFLKQAKTDFECHEYKYEDKGGSAVAARELGVDEHEVIKTLVFEDDSKNPLLVLMHGDRQVSVKSLARTLGVKTITPCTPETANKHTGYQVGGISPLGTKKTLPVYIEETILELDRIWVNAGKRGLLLEMKSNDLAGLTNAQPVSVALE
jgi:Cys-tRNA(Pro) deacylase